MWNSLLFLLSPMPSVAHTLYFYFSLMFLLGRTLAVSLYSAEIYDESQKPIKVLRCVPMEYWCFEAKRFSDEVSHDTVALTGMKFFYITRKLVLSVSMWNGISENTKDNHKLCRLLAQLSLTNWSLCNFGTDSKPTSSVEWKFMVFIGNQFEKKSIKNTLVVN